MLSSDYLRGWLWRPRDLVVSAAVNIALIALFWLYIFLSVRELAPVVLRRLLLWVVMVALYVPDAVVRGLGLRSYVYEAHDKMDAPMWYLSAAVVAIVGTLLYHAISVAGRAVYRWSRSPRAIGQR